MAPADVTLHNVGRARENIKQRYDRHIHKNPTYNVGDLVRISKMRSVFAKGYESGWTLELFRIVRTRQPPVYFLRDLSDEDVDGFFYEEELSRIRKELNESFFEVDKILKSRGKGRSKEYSVSWKGYPEKLNFWVKSNYLKDIKNERRILRCVA
ncbi:uncharacterized protein LOC106637933 [Copidosoma floridanum]|uniref:uncharacterized protein LOC106637933 n=1 Tax=Copidosoma floridanum TaxID=29053 RepID=UPI0006C96848|nr:uncharacterized protein LOC106637933 [Copidosoma floridanum]